MYRKDSLAAEMDDQDIQRFWAKVTKAEGCWIWQAAKDEKGYGIFQLNGSARRAHRIAYDLTHDAPLGESLGCHDCDTPSCVRPDHIWPGTADDNSKDCKRKGRTRPGHNPGGYKLPGANIGERNPRAKMDWARVRALRARYASGLELLKNLAAEYGIGFSTADKIVRFETWKEA